MFIIIELQTTNGQTDNIVQTREKQNEALSVYHSILASASISEVEYHTALVIDEQGRYIARECYTHIKEVIDESSVGGIDSEGIENSVGD